LLSEMFAGAGCLGGRHHGWV